MNLKFYLRGLGIGMTVTALLLHFSPHEAPEMSEKEIIEKARELGMTEKVTLKDVIVEEDKGAPTPVPTVILLPKSDNTPTPKPTATATPEATATAVPEATDTPTPKPTYTPTPEPTDTPTPKPTATATPTPKATDTPTPKPTATATPTPKPTSTPTPEPTSTPTPTPKPTSTPTPTPKPTATATPTPKPTSTPTPAPTATPTAAPTEAPEDDGSPKSLNSSSVEISVTPGDSSYTVAKRLAEAGVVPSAAEFDEYLCKNGYDRKIVTGMHTIPAYTSYRRIGEILAGKK